MMTRALLLASVLALAGCGDDLPPLSFPQIANEGGPVLQTPHVVPIFYAGDPRQSVVEDFLGRLATSSHPYWGQVTAEYGVGSLTIGPSLVLGDAPAAIMDSEIRDLLAAQLDGNHPEWPAVSDSNVYVFFYPLGTTIMGTPTATSCKEFVGYHNELRTASASVIYAVIARCPQATQTDEIDGITVAAAHELVEAATDPRVHSRPAWDLIDDDHYIWSIDPGAELADMCALEPQSYQRLVDGYLVPRIWSNRSAAAGKDPCAPLMGGAYYNAAPILSDTVQYDYGTGKFPTKGMKIGLNQKKIVEVELFGDGSADPWTVVAVDASYFTHGPQELDYEWDHVHGKAGDVLHVTITRIANGAHGGSEAYFYSEAADGSANVWLAFIEN